MYTAYYKCLKDILFENGIEMTKDNVCMGAEKVLYNNGVIDYFERFQSSKTGVKHYIVTSGIKDYVEKTAINEFVNGIYGVTYKQENGIFEDIDKLVIDKTKVDIIQKIQNETKETNKVIYFGDGLTDKYAFEYVHSVGGKSVFVLSNEQSKDIYQKLNTKGIIDECFEADYNDGAKISEYIKKQIE